MNLQSRICGLERERGRRCIACGGELVTRPARLTLDEVLAAALALTDLEKVELYRRSGREDLIPARLRELSAREGATS
jgi:hypothetical protein